MGSDVGEIPANKINGLNFVTSNKSIDQLIYHFSDLIENGYEGKFWQFIISIVYI